MRPERPLLAAAALALLLSADELTVDYTRRTLAGLSKADRRALRVVAGALLAALPAERE